MKKIMLLAAAVLMMPFLQGCKVGVGVGYGHGGWGRHHGGRHGGYHGGRHHGRHMEMAQASEAARLMAADFHIKPTSAETIIDVLESNTPEQDVAALGVNPADLMALKTFSMPSDSTIARIASTLGEDPAKIEALMSSYNKQVGAQSSDLNSNYWQTCVQAGHWSTPQNSSCSQTYWKGCSPKTGAQSCDIE